MGLGLHAAYPVFADAFDEVCAHLDGLLPVPLREVIAAGGPALDQTMYAQAGLFAVQVALFRLMSSWGVEPPQCVAGHSIGEVTAAHAAGVWALADACAVVEARGRALMQQLAGGRGDGAPWTRRRTQAAELVAGARRRRGRGGQRPAADSGAPGPGPCVDELARESLTRRSGPAGCGSATRSTSPLMEPVLEPSWPGSWARLACR